jgi:hypothetical protein
MANNWAIPRSEVINRAILVTRRGYYDSIQEAADSMVRLHYRGKSPSRALQILRRDLIEAYYDRHGGQSEARERIFEMAKELQAEGWRFIPAHNGRGGFWRHQKFSAEVNCNGGSFSSWEVATERAYNSGSREWVNAARHRTAFDWEVE